MTPKEIMAFLYDIGCDFEVISSEHIIRVTKIPPNLSLSKILDKFATETDYLYKVNMVTLLTRRIPDERPYTTRKQTALFLLKVDCDFEIRNKEEQIKIKNIPSEIALKMVNRLCLKREYKSETDVNITIFLKEYRSQPEVDSQKKKP